MISMKGMLKIDFENLSIFMTEIIEKSPWKTKKDRYFSSGILELLGPTIHHKLSTSQKQSLLSLPPNLFVPIYSVLSGKTLIPKTLTLKRSGSRFYAINWIWNICSIEQISQVLPQRKTGIYLFYMTANKIIEQ